VRDIDVRKRAEDALRASEALLSSIFYNSSNMMALTALENGKILDVNEEWLKATGMAREQVSGQRALDLGVWASIADGDWCTEKLITERLFRDYECKLALAGRPAVHLVSAEVLTIGRHNYVLWEFKNIDALRRSEESLMSLNRDLRMLSDCNQVLVRASDEAVLLDEICRIVCEEGGHAMAWVGFAENDPDKTIRVAAQAGGAAAMLMAPGLRGLSADWD
jgi:PAS domain S-box-containing protein